MENTIKRSVATLLAHIIKIDKRDLEKEEPLFCKLLGDDFDCNEEESKKLLRTILNEDYVLNDHINIINSALKDDKLSKMHILKQFNHIIYSDKIKPRDYEEFERVKKSLFPTI
jgi:uncharacterized tellurite resistance protein B-like protein